MISRRFAVQRAEVLEEDRHLDEVRRVVRDVDDDEGTDLLERVALDGRAVRSRFFSASSWTPWMISKRRSSFEVM